MSREKTVSSIEYIVSGIELRKRKDKLQVTGFGVQTRP